MQFNQHERQIFSHPKNSRSSWIFCESMALTLRNPVVLEWADKTCKFQETAKLQQWPTHVIQQSFELWTCPMMFGSKWPVPSNFFLPVFPSPPLSLPRCQRYEDSYQIKPIWAAIWGPSDSPFHIASQATGPGLSQECFPRHLRKVVPNLLHDMPLAKSSWVCSNSLHLQIRLQLSTWAGPPVAGQPNFLAIPEDHQSRRRS